LSRRPPTTVVAAIRVHVTAVAKAPQTPAAGASVDGRRRPPVRLQSHRRRM